MSICRLGQDCERRLKLAGGSKGLVESVVARVEHGLSLYKQDSDSLDEDYFESLKPDLEALIKITEEVAVATQSRSALYEKQSHKAQLVIGDCQANISAKQGEVNITNATLESIKAKVDLDGQKVQNLVKEIEENDRKLAEVRANNEELLKWFWVPGYGAYLSVRAIVELCEEREKNLCNDLNHGRQELDSTERRLEEERWKHERLVEEKRVMEWTIRDLRDSRMVLEQKCKVYAARFVLLSDILLYYRMLSNKIGDINSNLDLPMAIEQLYENRNLVKLNGEARQVTLKAALIHLGEDYDRHLQSGPDLADEVPVSFKLFPLNQPLPSNYRLATLEEAIDNKRALFKVMPSWEIANLADGSVDGQSYGGRVSSQVRNDVGAKLAVYQHSLQSGRDLGDGVPVTFKLFPLNQPLPSNYRLATVEEATDNKRALFKAMPSWEIANLADGSVDGQSYGGRVSSQVRNDVGAKLAIYRHLQSRRDLADGVHVTFKLFSLSKPLPSNCRLATVEEATSNKRALFKAMPSWEIANLADGSVSGQSYGGPVSSQVRNDVGHKLAVEE